VNTWGSSSLLNGIIFHPYFISAPVPASLGSLYTILSFPPAYITPSESTVKQ
jgi:hypothetical protein